MHSSEEMQGTGRQGSGTCTPTTQLLRRQASVRGPCGICSSSFSPTLTSLRALLICARERRAQAKLSDSGLPAS